MNNGGANKARVNVQVLANMESDPPYPYQVPPTWQYSVLVPVVNVVSLLSIAGSSGIVAMARSRQNEMLQRLLIALSLSDILSSVSFLLQPFLVPKWTGYPLAVGNTTTCTALGFLLHVGMVLVAGFNCAISLTFLLRIRFNVRESRISQYLEKPTYLLMLFSSVTIAVMALLFEGYNPSEFLHACTITAVPFACNSRDDLTCLRGENAWIVHMVQVGLMLVLTITSITSVLAVFCFVRRQTMNGSHRSFSRSTMEKRVRETALQALLYSFVYANMIVWIGIALSLAFAREEKDRDPFVVTLMLWIFLPIQGLFNFLVYTFPTVRRLREADPHKSLWRAYAKTIGSIAPSRCAENVEATGFEASSPDSADVLDSSAGVQADDPGKYSNEIGQVISEFFSSELPSRSLQWHRGSS